MVPILTIVILLILDTMLPMATLVPKLPMLTISLLTLNLRPSRQCWMAMLTCLMILIIMLNIHTLSKLLTCWPWLSGWLFWPYLLCEPSVPCWSLWLCWPCWNYWRCWPCWPFWSCWPWCKMWPWKLYQVNHIDLDFRLGQDDI